MPQRHTDVVAASSGVDVFLPRTLVGCYLPSDLASGAQRQCLNGRMRHAHLQKTEVRHEIIIRHPAQHSQTVKQFSCITFLLHCIVSLSINCIVLYLRLFSNMGDKTHLFTTSLCNAFMQKVRVETSYRNKSNS